MKKLALAAALFGVFGTAQAAGLSVTGSNITFGGYSGEPVTYTGARSSGQIGTIYASSVGTLEAVYLGQESKNFNLFNFSLFNGLNELDQPGESIYKTITSAGAINFAFTDLSTNIFKQYGNGSSSIAIMSGVIPGSVTNANNYGPFDYILGFNDAAKGDLDYDDFVVGLKFTPKNPSAVPVPAALPLMATALGLFGFGASRRRL